MANRATQAAVEVVLEPTSLQVRATQAAVEVLVVALAAGEFQPAIHAQSAVSVVSIFGNRYFGSDIAFVSAVNVLINVKTLFHPAIPGLSSLSITLTGSVPAVEQEVAIAATSTVEVQLSLGTSAMSWTGESALFITATAPEISLGQFNWSGESALSIMPGFTPTGVSAEQAIHIADADDGTWTATFNLQTTDPLAYNVTAGALQTALEGLTSIGSGNVVVTGGPGSSQPFLVRFSGILANFPVGLISGNGSGLSGPDGLNPRVRVIALSPGYAATDDYGTVDEIAVTVGGSLETWQYQGVMMGLKVTESDNSGDETATWSVEMTPPYSFPRQNSVVIISDLRGPWWAGLMEQPRFTFLNGYVKVDFTARGFFSIAHDLPYRQSRIWKEGSSMHTIVSEARNELAGGMISIIDDFIASGKSIEDDSEDFQKQYLAAIIDNYAALGDSGDAPLTYGVRLPLVDGYVSTTPVLYVEPEATVPSLVVYLADGASVEAEIDSSEMVNRYYVPWKIPDDALERSGTEAVDHPTSATQMGRLRAQWVGQTFPSQPTAVNYGTVLTNKHGAYRTSGASISIPGGVPVYTIGGHVFPHWRVRPNKVFAIPDLPESNYLLGIPEIDLRSSKFSWDQETDGIAITTGRLDDLKRVFRQLVKSPNELESQPNEPFSNTVTRQTDQTYHSAPWVPTGGGFSTSPAGVQQSPATVPVVDMPTTVRTITIVLTIPASRTNAIVQIDSDCVIRMVTLYAPIDQNGTAQVIIGHSTYAAYGSISNLTTLSISGIPGKARQDQIRQQLFAGDVVYAALPIPMTGYDEVTVAITCERS